MSNLKLGTAIAGFTNLATAVQDVDIVEIAFPFSDTAAETLATQQAFDIALKAGYTLDQLFAMVEAANIQIPIILRMYANPVYHYGKERFMAKCKALGIKAIAFQDAPFAENGEFEPAATACGIAIVNTLYANHGVQVEAIAKAAKAYVYVAGTPAEVAEITARVGKVTEVPCISRNLREI